MILSAVQYIMDTLDMTGVLSICSVSWLLLATPNEAGSQSWLRTSAMSTKDSPFEDQCSYHHPRYGHGRNTGERGVCCVMTLYWGDQP